MYVLSMYVNNGLHTYTVLDVINIHTRYNFVQYWCQRCCSFAGVNCQGCFSFLAPSLEAGGFCPAAFYSVRYSYSYTAFRKRRRLAAAIVGS